MTKDEYGFAVGDRFEWNIGEVRVLAVAEGWLMVRHRGCAPFLLFARDARTVLLTREGGE